MGGGGGGCDGVDSVAKWFEYSLVLSPVVGLRFFHSTSSLICINVQLFVAFDFAGVESHTKKDKRTVVMYLGDKWSTSIT